MTQVAVVTPSLGASPAGQRRSGWWLVGSAVFVLVLLLCAWGAVVGGDSTSSGFVVVPVLLLLTSPLLRLESRRNLVFDGAGIIFTALGVRCLGVFARLYMIEDLYSGVGDSVAYDSFGRMFAESFRRLDFDVDPERPVPGTGFLRILTGVVYVFVGSDRFAGFLVFGFFAFLGTYLFYRAFVIALPDGDHRRYALLIFFWPSLVFWPSSIGKEAWMLLGMGLASWGLARVLTRGRLGYTAMALGVLALYQARPHMALLLVSGAGVAAVMALLFRSGDSVKSFGFASKATTVVALTVMGALLAPQVADFFDVEDLGRSGVTEALEAAEEQTSQGGSSFDTVTVNNPVDYPLAFVTVMFRPFPNEASNTQAVISAAEGLLLMLLLLASFRAIIKLPREVVRKPYLAYAASYVLMFAYVFSSIGNFGILTRQRVQVLPMLIVFVALPLSARSRRNRSRRRSPVDPEIRKVAEPETSGPRLKIARAGIGPPRPG